MSSVDFEHLINLMGHRISKNDTNSRKAIPVKERSAITLRFLTTGGGFLSQFNVC